MFKRLTDTLDLLIQVVKLPVADLHFNPEKNPENVLAAYKNFTKRHPRYKVFRNKSIGAALIDLTQFRDRDEYMKYFMKKKQNSKKARARGYVVRTIDMNEHIDDIHEINTSMPSRQGRPMGESYLVKKEFFESISNYQYYGVLNKEGKLVGYCSIAHYGDFAAFSQCLGIRNNEGCMDLMLAEVICRLIDCGNIRYVLFDTWFGAQPGLQRFKASFGFQPYRAKYSLV